MTSLDIDRQARVKLPQVNWGIVAAVLTIVGWMLAGVGGVFSDYRDIGHRVTVLETQRVGDKQQMDRIESKVDRILEHWDQGR